MSRTQTDRSVSKDWGALELMSQEIIKLEVSDCIAGVTLSRPVVNALDRTMRERMVSIFDEISECSEIRAAVPTGADKVFGFGADLKDRPDPSKTGSFLSYNRITRETGNSIRECAKPVIATAAHAVAALSRLAVAHAETVAEVDIDPLLLMARDEGAVVLDALLAPHKRTKTDQGA